MVLQYEGFGPLLLLEDWHESFWRIAVFLQGNVEGKKFHHECNIPVISMLNEKRRKISDLFFHRMIGPLASGETPNFWYHLEGNFMNCLDVKSEFYLVVWGGF